MKRKPQTLTIEKLAPGEGIAIRTAKTPKQGMSAERAPAGPALLSAARAGPATRDWLP